MMKYNMRSAKNEPQKIPKFRENDMIVEAVVYSSGDVTIGPKIMATVLK